MKRLDLTGHRYGRLTALRYAGNTRGGKTRWLCRCECGNESIVQTLNLRNGHTRSCGCLQAEVARSKVTTHGLSIDDNGKVSRLHHIWTGMRQRCGNPNAQAYQHYGGRGIKICDEWGYFEAFHAWAVSNGYEKTLEIDRIDNDGDYEPTNCRWATRAEQTRNRRFCRMITFRGRTKHLQGWARETGIQRGTIANRLNSGWPVERALTEPVNQQ